MTFVAISMTGALADLLIDFQFYAAAASANMGSKGNASFFANFNISPEFQLAPVATLRDPENPR